MPGDEEVNPTKLFTTVLDEMRAFRRENANQHEAIRVSLTKRNDIQDQRMNSFETRTRKLENWRSYLVGIGGAVTLVAGLLYLFA